jgi:hypothetical protein
MQSQPLFVVGSPRSGTTFLCNVLNQHPLIELTNESRIFVLLQDLLEIRSRTPDLLEPVFRKPLTRYVRRNLGGWVEQFYREELGVTAPIWGDKHPPYADPNVLTAHAARLSPAPRTGSSLRTIGAALPHAKFIHVHRDPRYVAYSMLRKGWVDSLEDAVSVWRRHVEEIDAFFDEIPADRHLTLRYADLVEQPHSAAAAITDFLDLGHDGGMAAFLAAEQNDPTPFSEPVTDLAASRLAIPSVHPAARALQLAGQHAERLGYAA